MIPDGSLNNDVAGIPWWYMKYWELTFQCMLLAVFDSNVMCDWLTCTQRRWRARLERSTVLRTAAYIVACVCRRRWCVTVDATVCKERTRRQRTAGRWRPLAPATPANSAVTTASVSHSDGSVTTTTTVETWAMSRPTVVCSAVCLPLKCSAVLTDVQGGVRVQNVQDQGQGHDFLSLSCPRGQGQSSRTSSLQMSPVKCGLADSGQNRIRARGLAFGSGSRL